MRDSIVITGYGVVTPFGVGPAALWDGLTGGRSAITELRAFETDHLRCRVGGVIDAFDAEELLGLRLARKLARFSHVGVVAAARALEDADMDLDRLASTVPADAPDYVRQARGRDRVGVAIGNNLGGGEFAERELRNLWLKSARDVSPHLATAWFPSSAHGWITITAGIKGIARTFACDRVASAYALVHAARCLRAGHADVMLAGGVEAPFSPYLCLASETSGLMSATETYRPFDRTHNGLVLGEGGAVMVLERASDALARGARIHAELAGFALSNDAYDSVRCAPNGEILARTISTALRRAEVGPADVDYVCAAGSAIPFEDESEASAIRIALGADTDRTPVSAPKASFGNLFGAASAVDVVAGMLAMQHRTVPPTHDLKHVATGCELDHVLGSARKVDRLDVVAVNARGLGGANGSLVLRRWAPDGG